MPDVDKGRIKAGHHFANFSDQNIAYAKVVIGFLVMQLYEFTAFEQGQFDAFFGGVNYKFFLHNGDKFVADRGGKQDLRVLKNRQILSSETGVGTGVQTWNRRAYKSASEFRHDGLWRRADSLVRIARG